MATQTYLLSVQGAVLGSYNECVLAFQSTGLSATDTLDAAGDLVNAFQAHAQTLWLDCLPASYYLNILSARRATPAPSAEAHIQYQAFSVQGLRGAGATAYNLCPSVFLVPPMGTKSGGRVFMPAIAQGDLTNNSYLGAYVTAIDNLFTALTAGLAGSGTNWQLAIYSRKNLSTSLALSWVLSPRIGFQGRRRNPAGA